MKTARSRRRSWRPLLAAGLISVLTIGGCSATFNTGNMSITSLDVITGPSAGGTVVTITGVDFQSNIEVRFDGVLAINVTLLSATQVTVTTPPGAPGPADVTVGFGGFISDTLSGGFTYISNPQITALTPSEGGEGGGTTVTATGTDFMDGATFTVGGSAAANVTFVSSTQITFDTPTGTAGTVDVVIANPDSQSFTLTGGFRYTGPPIPGSLLPSAGQPAGGETVTVFGLDFLDGATVSVDGAPPVPATFISGTEIRFVAPAGTAGTSVDVTVINPDTSTGTLSGAYTYSINPAPVLSSLDVTSGPRSGGTVVTLSGSGFLPVVTVLFDGSAAAITSTAPGSIVVTTPAGMSGPADIVLINGDGQMTTLPAGFTYDPRPVFVLHDQDRSISMLGLDEGSGALTLVSHTVIPAATLVPTDIATLTDGATSYVYISMPGIGGGQVRAFTATSTGVLTEVTGSPYATDGTAPISLTTATIAGSSYLFVVNRDTNTVSGFAITAGTGALTAVAGSPFATGGIGSELSLFAPVLGGSGGGGMDVLFVSNVSSGDITAFSIGAGGALTAQGVPGQTTLPLPRSLAFGNDRLFVLHTTSIEVFDLTLPGGALSATAVAGSPFLSQATNASGEAIAFESGGGAGGRVLAAATFPLGLSVYDVAADGSLSVATLLGPVSTGPVNPTGVVSILGRAVVVHSAIPLIGVLDLPAGAGDPTPVTGSPFGTGGAGPVRITIGE